jgi:hypothetical protein
MVRKVSEVARNRTPYPSSLFWYAMAAISSAQWIEDRQAEYLDTQYFHVVFTLPKCVRRGIDRNVPGDCRERQSGPVRWFDGTHDSALRRGQRSGTLFPIGFAVATQHVGDFQLGTIHGPVLRSTAPTESSCLIGPAMPGQPVSQLLSLCPTPQRDASPLDRRSHPANGSVDPMESIQTP